MLGPNWEEGCKSCSFLADHFDATRIHLAHRDDTLAVVSQAPMLAHQAFQNRMGWRFHWVSAFANDFQSDYGVHFTKEELAGEVIYNYSKTQFRTRGSARSERVLQGRNRRDLPYLLHLCPRARSLMGTYRFLDFTPKGRDEDGLTFSMSWVRHHDKYDDITS